MFQLKGAPSAVNMQMCTNRGYRRTLTLKANATKVKVGEMRVVDHPRRLQRSVAERKKFIPELTFGEWLLFNAGRFTEIDISLSIRIVFGPMRQLIQCWSTAGRKLNVIQ